MSVAKLRSTNEGGCIISLVSSLLVTCVTLIVLNVTADDFAYFSCVVSGERVQDELRKKMKDTLTT